MFQESKVTSCKIEDYTVQIQNVSSNVKLLYDSRVEDDNDDLVIDADKHRIIQVISNLLSNSFKFTQEGIILVTTRKDNTNSGNQVIVSVKDTGTGIDPEILPRLFTKFATKSNRGAGTGLVLYISKNIIKAHGGRIWAENNIDSKGATFSFSLPISS
jgi:two-component system sensor histidine kinase VicK